MCLNAQDGRWDFLDPLGEQNWEHARRWSIRWPWEECHGTLGGFVVLKHECTQSPRGPPMVAAGPLVAPALGSGAVQHVAAVPVGESLLQPQPPRQEGRAVLRKSTHNRYFSYLIHYSAGVHHPSLMPFQHQCQRWQLFWGHQALRTCWDGA